MRSSNEPTTTSLLVAATPLFTAIALLMAGSGLVASLVGIRAGLEGFGATSVGLIVAGYYVGFLAGSLLTPPLIERVGHIRAFSGLASLGSAAVLVHGVLVDPAGWWLLRLVTGFCMSGLFVVAETWLNGTATNANRGQLLATYMVVVTASQGAGQLLLNVADPAGFAAFVLTSVLVSLAVVPITCATVVAPEVTRSAERMTVRDLLGVAPLGVVGAAASGFTAATMVGLGAVYAREAGLSVGRTSVLLFAALAGAVALQFPIGAVSDRVDRRRVIVVVGVVAAFAAGLATLFEGPDRLWALVPVVAVAGGAAFPLYSLSCAHVNDYLPGGALVSAGALLVLVNGAGAVVGPVVGAVVIQWAGAAGFFWVLAAGYAVTAAYAAYRVTRRSPASPEDRATFVPLPTGVAPTVAALAPGAADELYPATEGVAFRGGDAVPWRERGGGPPVLVAVDGRRAMDAVDGAALALADLGFRTVVAALPPDRAAEALDVLLTDRDLPVTGILAIGGAARPATELAAAHGERVRALVAVVDDLGDLVPARTAVLVVAPAEWRRVDDDGVPVALVDVVVPFLRTAIRVARPML